MIRTARYLSIGAEAALALCVVASAALAARHLAVEGFLPQPFVFDTNDTLMDWFNTAYWANNPGAYEVWRSIYPPLSFVFLDSFSLPGCYLQSSFHARDCDWLGRATIGFFYVLDVALVWLSFRRIDPATAPMRTAAFALGLPLLFTLERGNLILVCFAFFVIAHGPLVRSRRWRSIAAAVTINFKPYLLLALAGWVLKRRWRLLELVGFATIAIYLASLAWAGGGTIGELAVNTANWVEFQSGQVWNEVNYSTSYAPLMLVRPMQVPVLEFVSSRLIESIEWAVPLVIRCTQAIALVTLVGAWLQPGAASAARLSAVALGAYLVTQSPGGYTQVFLLFLVLLEPLRRPGPVVAILCAYALCLVGDVPLATVLEISSASWLTDRPVNPVFGLTWGHFVRPGLIVLIVWALSLDTLAHVVGAHRRRRPSFGLAPA